MSLNSMPKTRAFIRLDSFKSLTKNGSKYTALSTPIFNNNLKLVVIKSRSATAAISGFYRDILLGLLILLPIQFFLINSISEKIYRNIKILLENFRKIPKKSESLEIFSHPLHLVQPLEYQEFEDVQKMWGIFLDEFYRTLQEIKVEKR